MATLNFTNVRPYDNAGIRNRRIVTYTGPNPYVAGGDPFTPAEVKLKMIESFGGANGVVASNAAFTAVRIVLYDYTNAVCRWFIPNTGAEVAAGVDLSGFSARVEVAGI